MKFSELQERCVRWESTSVKLMGIISVVFSLCLLFPAICAVFYGEDPVPFLLPVPPLFLAGSFMYMTFSNTKNFRPINGILLVAFAWVFMFFVCTLPYLVYGLDPMDAVFEAVSGLTTTGMTVLGDLETYPISILIWRSMSQWIGGIIVVLFFLYFMPMMGIGRGLFSNELAGSGSSNFIQKASKAASSFIFIYAALSILNFLILLILGVSLLESMCLMFTTISTGGLMIFNSNMSTYSDAVQWVTIIFMILGATNFYLHYKSIYRKEKRIYRNNSEFKMMIGWFLLISVVITFLIIYDGLSKDVEPTLSSFYQTFKNSLFTTVSLGTTSGFFIEDYTLWPSQCTILLMIVAIIGASSSSTSGGVKFSRIRIIYGYMMNTFRSMTNPNAVYAVKMDGTSIDDSAIRSAILVLMMYVCTLIVGAVVFMVFGHDMVDSIGLTISSISNGGMGFGNFGPTGDFTTFGNTELGVITFLMWMGRLEIVTAVLLFTPGFWKEFKHDNRAAGRRAKNLKLRRS